MMPTPNEIKEALQSTQQLYYRLRMPQRTESGPFCWLGRIGRAQALAMSLQKQDKEEKAQAVFTVVEKFNNEMANLAKQATESYTHYQQLCQAANIQSETFNYQCDCAYCTYHNTHTQYQYLSEELWYADDEAPILAQMKTLKTAHAEAAKAMGWSIYRGLEPCKT